MSASHKFNVGDIVYVTDNLIQANRALCRLQIQEVIPSETCVWYRVSRLQVSSTEGINTVKSNGTYIVPESSLSSDFKSPVHKFKPKDEWNKFRRAKRAAAVTNAALQT